MHLASSVSQTAAISDVRLVHQVCTLTSWVGTGRTLTQSGRVRLADARELVELLDTGDELDGRYPTTTSAELPELSLIVEWAKACRLVRVVRGRLVPVKKNADLLDRPTELWDRMFEAFSLLGAALCPDGWVESLMRHHFQEALDAVLLEAYRSGGPIAIADAYALAWEIVTARYFLDHASEEHRARWRTMNDRDVRYALGALERLGALQRSDDTVTLTEPAMAAMRRASGDASPGDAVLQLKISLIGVTKPPVWRRLLVPAGTRLDRLHEIIQTSMGWHDGHLHVFSVAGAEYGLPDPELGHRDERRTTLDRLIARAGDRMRYTYDFGDDWEHEILVEKVLSAEPGGRYPACVGGKSRCPPEDCGGAWGYSDLRETLADPGHDEHEEMLEWLGLENGSEFDPAAFDVDEVNAVLA